MYFFIKFLVHNKYTMTAKSVLKICRNQMMEIETCPDCFLASCTQENNWFCKPCVSLSVWSKGAPLPPSSFSSWNGHRFPLLLHRQAPLMKINWLWAALALAVLPSCCCSRITWCALDTHTYILNVSTVVYYAGSATVNVAIVYIFLAIQSSTGMGKAERISILAS